MITWRKVMKMKLTKFIKKKSKLFFGILLKLLEAIIEIIIPICLTLIIDKGILLNDKSYILKVVLIMFLLVLFGFLCSMYAQYIAYDVSEDYAKELRKGIYHQINKLTPSELNEFSKSSLTNRLTLDVLQSSNAVSMSIRIAARAPFLIVGSIISIYIINKKLSLILFVSLLFLMLILIIILIKSMNSFKKVQVESDNLSRNVRTRLTGIRIIKAFNQEEKEKDNFQYINQELGAKMNKSNFYQLLATPLTTVIMYLILVVLIYISTGLINNGNISISKTTSLLTYTTQLIVALVSVMNLIMIYTKSISSNQRIKEILNTKENKNKEYLELKKIEKIVFKNVSYTYPGRNTPTVKDVSINIEKPSITGFTGKTGSGKSTILQMLSGYFEPNSGEIIINGHNMNKYNPYDINKKIGYVSQKAEFLKGTIIDNITMNDPSISKEKVIQALKDSLAYDFVMEKENNLYGLVEEKGVNFSGGQRQRLALARAFAHDYDVLILDDSFSALDFLTESIIRTNIVKMFKDKILILISVRKSTLAASERIYIVEEGLLDNDGTNEELLKTSQLYRTLVEEWHYEQLYKTY